MAKNSVWSYLDSINSPGDLRSLEEKDLESVANELRNFLIDVISETGGHLASGLGTVELAIALHYVFDTPNDRLVWDIGHQAYPHKILTGRRREMHTIRKKDGLSGFLKRSESEYDTFGAGHSSTSISAALGMAIAAKLSKIERHVIAIIGDGALTAGQAMEALYNAGDLGANLLVILNDNEMSISRNVGAMSNYLARILSGKAYTTVREGSKTVLGTVPPMRAFARRWEEHLKGMVMPSTLFEELGFNYIGPIDGHNIQTLTATLKNMKAMDGPRLLHIATQKGKGYKPAEGQPITFHGIGPFDPNTGKVEKKSGKRTYTQVFGDWLCEMAEKDDRLIAITPAMREGSGLVNFAEQFPEKYFDVGIAEQHALTFAAGTACDGLKPVVAIYSTFLQRAYDQFIHDISVQHLDVTFAIDRAGIVGADGPTHQGAFDLSFLRCIPGITILAPSDENECRNMLFTAFKLKGPAAVRYPRGSGPGMLEQSKMEQIPIGKAEMRMEGVDIAILAFGTMLAPSLEAGASLKATVVNMRSVKPLDTDMICKLAESHNLFVTVEENTVHGGAGAGVAETLSEFGITIPLIIIGLPDHHIEHGDPAEVLASCGLNSEGIIRTILDRKPETLYVSHQAG